jgi:hypothetical protein
MGKMALRISAPMATPKSFDKKFRFIIRPSLYFVFQIPAA